MHQDEYAALQDDIKSLPSQHVYLNSTPVVTVNNTELNTWDCLTAAVWGNMNILLFGEKGEGKTQIENDIRNCFFGGKATYVRMHDDFTLSDLYASFNLEKLSGDAGTVQDAQELLGSVNNALTIVDELNRAHLKVQNRLFSIFDKYIVFKAEKTPLGIEREDRTRYHIAVGSANIDALRYGGTSVIDDAMLDRSHVILNINNYFPNAVDTATARLRSAGRGIEDFDN
ncbi:MAG: AAA family ATPase [Candidatus Woesearchaeota archaeon]|jgi:MoxR-like ATPase|nr:AAA family ATPase [Candidatus Woesearchaeota archaeon]MDP7198189.1 AAA family ATPase [Candidatus Woesearchaeota archaeon]MDP7467025.1 AAA family ATPase [Candidatus Woesearchaeota archaeon]MDP7646694.1 AAA family ATPase [Candidatus Woesearchaeota archaeon]